MPNIHAQPCTGHLYTIAVPCIFLLKPAHLLAPTEDTDMNDYREMSQVFYGTEWTSGARTYTRYVETAACAEKFGHYLMTRGRTGVCVVEVTEEGSLLTFWSL